MLPPKPFVSIPLVALIIISVLGACMEIDISVPSFPSIMDFFGATEAQVQNTLSVNFLAVCLSGLLYGPLSEAWGRRGLMLFGATCFLLGAIGCALAFSINQLLFWRFIQGLGASSAFVLGFTMIADRYQGEIAAKRFSQINAYVTIFMALAPILGSTIIHYFSWRANFTAVALIAFVAWVLLMGGLPETKLEKQALNLKGIVLDYGYVITHRRFMLYALIPNLMCAAYLTFVGTAAFYYMNTCGLDVMVYAIHQGLVVLVFSVTSFYANKIIARLGSNQAVLLGMSLTLIGTILFVSFAFLFPFTPVLITTAMIVIAIGSAFPMSVTWAESMEIIPHLKGTCSSFIMSLRLLLSSIAVAITGVFFDGSMRPVALVIFVAILLSLVCYIPIYKPKEIKEKLETKFAVAP